MWITRQTDLKVARYPQANNRVDNCFHASYTKIGILPPGE